MVRIDFKVKGAEEVKRKIHDLAYEVSYELPRNTLNSEAKVLQGIVKRNAPVKTGRLRRSIRHEVVSDKEHVIKVNPVDERGTHYAVIVEEGAKRHRIPKTGYRFMWWYDEEGNLRTASKVNHPGFRGRWYARKSVDEYVKGLRARIEGKVMSAIRKVWRR